MYVCVCDVSVCVCVCVCMCVCVWYHSARGPGERIDHTLVARGCVHSRQCVGIPDFNRPVKASGGQEVRIIWFKFAVKDGLHVALEEMKR